MADILSVERVSKRFGVVQALADVSFSLRAGEVHCLVGENGSGKSTLIKVISGVLKPDSGEIRIDGRIRSRFGVSEAIEAGIQVIYQDLSLFPNLTVAENIALSTLVKNSTRTVSWREVRRIADTALETIGMSIAPDAFVEELSVSQRQIVAICRALTAGARIVVMDEPTTALTRREVDRLFGIILSLQERGMSILFVSHKLSEVFSISQRVTVLRDGEIQRVFEKSELDRKQLIYSMTGRDISTHWYNCSETGCPELLRVEHLSRRGDFEDVSFTLGKGEILGVTGLLGSGRTELASAIFGLTRCDSGKIFLEGRQVDVHNPADAITRGISLLPEDRLGQGLFLRKSILLNIGVCVMGKYRTWARFLDFGAMMRELNVLAERLRVKAPSLATPLSSLSGGNQQKVALARWIAAEPKVLILDSPTVGIDIASKSEIYDIIQGLAAGGLGVMLISDEIPEIVTNCSRVLVMSDGRIHDQVTGHPVDEEQLNRMVLSSHAND